MTHILKNPIWHFCIYFPEEFTKILEKKYPVSLRIILLALLWGPHPRDIRTNDHMNSFALKSLMMAESD